MSGQLHIPATLAAMQQANL